MPKVVDGARASIVVDSEENQVEAVQVPRTEEIVRIREPQAAEILRLLFEFRKDGRFREGGFVNFNDSGWVYDESEDELTLTPEAWDMVQRWFKNQQ